MRVRVITIGLALAIGCSSLGCKSAPKMSWWKSGDKAEATTTAQAAPQLPSEMAKQAESLAAASNPVQITTPAVTSAAASLKSAAPAYTAATPSAYPSTGAPGYLPTTSAAVSTPVAASTKSIAAVSSALPYNPAAVPPATSAAAPNAAIASTPAPQADRYANAYPATTTPSYPAASSYPTTTTPAPAATQSASNTPATASVPFATNPSSTTLGNRYATQPAPVTTPISTTLPSTSTPVQTASAVASVQPYRPGGTSTYPGTSASYEVATRPGTTTNTAAPNSSYPAQQSGTQYR